MILAASSLTHFLFGFVLIVISIFLILLVLVQRGRGGGLTGALGGMGGQSAFGTKAGDTFTRITYATAVVWIFVSMLAIKLLQETDTFGSGGPSRTTISDAPGGDKGPSPTKGDGAGATKTDPPATQKSDPPATTPDAEKASK